MAPSNAPQIPVCLQGGSWQQNLVIQFGGGPRAKAGSPPTPWLGGEGVGGVTGAHGSPSPPATAI